MGYIFICYKKKVLFILKKDIKPIINPWKVFVVVIDGEDGYRLFLQV